MASNSAESSNKAKGMTQEQIVSGFQELRNQQRAVASKISELEVERKEHELVVEALKEVDPERKCFRMVGGVLVERTAKEVLPALETNCESIIKLIQSLNTQLTAKGKEINSYKERHNLKIRGEEEAQQRPKEDAAKSSGVLVAAGSM